MRGRLDNGDRSGLSERVARQGDGAGGEGPGGEAGFPAGAGIVLGLGLGGFVDGILFHQILQWHHMASSAGMATGTVGGLRAQVRLDGLFHAATWGLVLVGLVMLWRAVRGRAARGTHAPWRAGQMGGALLAGWGLFNLAEGVVNHHLLGLHHVNETVPRDQWIWWDGGFLVVGALLVAVGLALMRDQRSMRASSVQASAPPSSIGTSQGPEEDR